jgi:DNA-binding transcriptional regulator YiaG
MPKTLSRSRQLAALHGAATALHDVGALDKKTMRNIDALCLTKVETGKLCDGVWPIRLTRPAIT